MSLNPQSKKLLLKLADGGAELDGDCWKQCRYVIDVPHRALEVLLKRGLAIQSLTLTQEGQRLVRQFEREDERGADWKTEQALAEVADDMARLF